MDAGPALSRRPRNAPRSEATRCRCIYAAQQSGIRRDQRRGHADARADTAPWRRESDPERGLEIFDHREMTHVEGREIQPFHVRCGRDQVISEPDTLMRAPVLAHELPGAPCDPL